MNAFSAECTGMSDCPAADHIEGCDLHRRPFRPLERLRLLAQAAGPGPWHINPLDVVMGNDILDGHGSTVAEAFLTTDARYIAAASPDVILALLAEIDRLIADADRLAKALQLNLDCGCQSCAVVAIDALDQHTEEMKP